MKRLLLLFCVVMALACNRDEYEGEFVGPKHDATLKITVRHYEVVNGVQVDANVQNANVSLHASDAEAQSNSNAIKSANTGTTGQVTFADLELDKHFIRGSHPAYGVKVSPVSTPARSVTIWEVIL